MVYELWGGLGLAKNVGAGACMEKSIFFLRCLKPEFQKTIAKGIFGYFFFD